MEISKANIMIVEDEAIVAEEIKTSLEGMGYSVTSIVETGEAAIEKAQQDRPDVMLMDIRLEGQIDGIEAAERIRSRFGIPVIFLTAYTEQHILGRAKVIEPFGYILKPYRDRDLRATIEMALYKAEIDAARMRIEEALRNSEERYRTLFDQAPIMYIITRNQEGLPIVEDCNELFLSTLGYSRSEVAGKPLTRFYSPESSCKMLEGGYLRTLEGRFIPEERGLLTRDGGVIETVLYAFPETDVNGQVWGARAMYADITERKRAEEEIRGLARFPSENPNPVLRIAKDGTILYANAAGLHLLKAWGCSVGQCLPEDWRKFTVDVIRSGSSKEAEFEYDNRVTSIMFAPVAEENYVNLYGIDVTERKQAEVALKKAQDELEQRVEERTAELIKANEQLNQEVEARKRTAEALKNTERRYRELFEDSPVMYVITRIDNGVPIIENCNELFLNSLGYRRDQVLERPLADFYTSESKNKLLEGYTKALAGRFTDEERQLAAYDGRVVEVLLRALPQKDSKGRVVGTRAMYLDITERKIAQKELEDSEARYQELFNEAPVGYHELDSEGRITRVNQTELDMLGYSAEEMLGRPIWEFVVEEEASRKAIAAKISGAIPPDKVFERTRKRKDGTTFQSLSRARQLKDEQGRITGFRTTMQDISDKKRTEDQLRKSKTMLQAVFDGISEPLIMVDEDMRVKMLNRPATQLYNIEYHEAIGNFCFKAFKARSEQCEDCRIPSAVSAGEQVIYERKGYKDPDRIEKVTIYPVREKERKTESAIIRINDITAEKKMGRELIQADKMISLGILVSGVAHEINNPNNFIMLNTPLLWEAWEAVVPILEKYYEENGDFSMAGLSYSEMREEVPILFKGIEDGSSRIKHIVEDLKDYSRLDIAEMDQTVDVNKAIKSAVNLVNNLIKKSTRKFRLNCQNNLPPIKGNLQKLEQVVINLIQNACHALSDTEEGVFVTAFFDEEKDGIVIEVRDEGRGIPDELLPRIMDPFYTTKRDQGGTGLGLSVSLKIVKEHGGTIDVKSERGEGSTFKIFLPVKRKEKLVKILVADDEDTVREFLTTVLRENRGYSVREASTGTEACVKLGSDRPDLLILDVIMPDMNGVEVCRLIRKEPKLSGIRIIVVTGFPDSPEVKEIADMGFNNILHKPFKASDLMETVAAVLEDGR